MSLGHLRLVPPARSGGTEILEDDGSGSGRDDIGPDRAGTGQELRVN